MVTLARSRDDDCFSCDVATEPPLHGSVEETLFNIPNAVIISSFFSSSLMKHL